MPSPAVPRLVMPPRIAPMFGLAVLLSIALLALAPASGRSATHTVDIADFAYTPTTLTIAVGDTVTWTNSDPVEHTATSTTGGWDTGPIAQGASASITFTEPGTYDYLCTPHPTMTGRIVVTAAPAEPAATPQPSGGALPDVAMPTDARAWPVALGIGLVGLAGLLAVRRSRHRAIRQD